VFFKQYERENSEDYDGNDDSRSDVVSYREIFGACADIVPIVSQRVSGVYPQKIPDGGTDCRKKQNGDGIHPEKPRAYRDDRTQSWYESVRGDRCVPESSDRFLGPFDAFRRDPPEKMMIDNSLLYFFREKV